MITTDRFGWNLVREDIYTVALEQLIWVHVILDFINHVPSPEMFQIQVKELFKSCFEKHNI
jgi:hypothetical protein